MLGFFRTNRTEKLQKQYDKLMMEAFMLVKADPEASLKKQTQAIEVQKRIVLMSSK